MPLSENCSHRNTQTWAKEKKLYGNFPTVISCHPLPVYCFRLDEPVYALARGTLDSSKPLLDDYFDMEGRNCSSQTLGTNLELPPSRIVSCPQSWEVAGGKAKEKVPLDCTSHFLTLKSTAKKNVPENSWHLLEFPERNKFSSKGHFQGATLRTVEAIVGFVRWHQSWY